MRLGSLGVAPVAAALVCMLCRAADAGPPFRTDDPGPVDYGHWEITAFAQSTEAEGDTSGIMPGIEINYGVLPNTQLHVIAPLAFDHPAGSGSKFGYGDTELGVKYRLFEEDVGGWRPEAAIFPTLEAPTANAARGLGTGHTQAYLPLWLQKTFGRWTVDAGGGYWINPGLGNRDYWFAGWLVQRQITDHLSLGAEIFNQTASVAGGRDQTGFTIGGVYDINDNHHLLFSVGRGVQNAATTNEFSYYVAYQLTF